MDSKTKYALSQTETEAIFEAAKLGAVSVLEPLGAGMFNAVYKVVADGKSYAIKIAPTATMSVMTYEKNLLDTEVMWYRVMAEKTNIDVPKIYYVDKSKSIIPAPYFIMEFVEGDTLNALKLDPEERKAANLKLIENVAQLHEIRSEKFGYVQNGLFDNWYDALASFVQSCIDDLTKVGKKSRRAQKVLQYVKSNKQLLQSVKGCLVNYDAWDLNIVGRRTDDGLKCTWIDPERGFFGDAVFDFICIDLMKMSLTAKLDSVEQYNAVAKEKIVVDGNSEIRFAFALGYMAVIQETEKYYRYKLWNIGWWYDVVSSNVYYRSCFKLLKKYCNKK